MSKQHFRLLFGLIAGGELIGRLIDYQLLDYIFKPLLLPVLALYFWTFCPKPAGIFAKTLLAGLLFSWAGDVFLMFDGYFIAGLLSFLTAHIFYVWAFWVSAGRKISGLKRFYWAVPLYAAIVGGLLYFLKDSLGPLQIPVFVYASVLALMSAAALNRFGRVPTAGFRLIFVGSLFFIASDSVLAINKFQGALPFAGLTVMVTYMLAQFLITEGALVNKESGADF